MLSRLKLFARKSKEFRARRLIPATLIVMYKRFVSSLLLYPICLVSMSISAQGQGTPGPANPATAQVAPASVPQAADQSPLAKAEQLYRAGKLAEPHRNTTLCFRLNPSP